MDDDIDDEEYFLVFGKPRPRQIVREIERQKAKARTNGGKKRPRACPASRKSAEELQRVNRDLFSPQRGQNSRGRGRGQKRSRKEPIQLKPIPKASRGRGRGRGGTRGASRGGSRGRGRGRGRGRPRGRVEAPASVISSSSSSSGDDSTHSSWAVEDDYEPWKDGFAVDELTKPCPASRKNVPRKRSARLRQKVPFSLEISSDEEPPPPSKRGRKKSKGRDRPMPASRKRQPPRPPKKEKPGPKSMKKRRGRPPKARNGAPKLSDHELSDVEILAGKTRSSGSGRVLRLEKVILDKTVKFTSEDIRRVVNIRGRDKLKVLLAKCRPLHVRDRKVSGHVKKWDEGGGRRSSFYEALIDEDEEDLAMEVARTVERLVEQVVSEESPPLSDDSDSWHPDEEADEIDDVEEVESEMEVDEDKAEEAVKDEKSSLDILAASIRESLSDLLC